MTSKNVHERAAIERDYLAASGCTTLINCLSGGVDSTVSALISQAACPTGTLGLLLPCSSAAELAGERHQDVVDGQRVADHLSVPAVTVPLSDLWQQATTLFTQAAQEMALRSGQPLDDAKLAWAINNLKPTLRMMTAGFFADAFQGLMMGTDNVNENYFGYFSIRGDGIADRQPIRDCLKAEVCDLAAAGGFPADLVGRTPTAGLWPGQTDEAELGWTYPDGDRFVHWVLAHPQATVWHDGTMTVRPAAVDAILGAPDLPVAREVAVRMLAQNQRTGFKRKADDLVRTLAARGQG